MSFLSKKTAATFQIFAPNEEVIGNPGHADRVRIKSSGKGRSFSPNQTYARKARNFRQTVKYPRAHSAHLGRNATNDRRMHRQKFQNKMMAISPATLRQTEDARMGKPVGADQHEERDFRLRIAGDNGPESFQTCGRGDGASVITPAFGREMREFQRVAHAGTADHRAWNAPAIDPRQIFFAAEHEFDRLRFAVNEDLELHD